MNTIEVVDKIYENDFAVINLTYDAISSKEIVNVVGKITNIKDVTVSKIKIESSNSADYSGVYGLVAGLIYLMIKWFI